ncbi:ATPase, V1 complex, subunit D, partial [Kipferlia bialata]
IPTFNLIKEGEEKPLRVGLHKGGKQVNAAKQAFTVMLERFVKLAAMQASYVALEEVLMVTNRRVNALENVVIPKIVNSIAYIVGELDEIEREEFFRLKKVQDKKQRDKAQAKKEEEEKHRLRALAAEAAGEEAEEEAPTFDAVASMTGIVEEDDDIVV